MKLPTRVQPTNIDSFSRKSQKNPAEYLWNYRPRSPQTRSEFVIRSLEINWVKMVSIRVLALCFTFLQCDSGDVSDWKLLSGGVPHLSRLSGLLRKPDLSVHFSRG